MYTSSQPRCAGLISGEFIESYRETCRRAQSPFCHPRIRAIFFSFFFFFKLDFSLTFQLRRLDREHVQGQQLQQPCSRQRQGRVMEERPELAQHLNGSLLERLHSATGKRLDSILKSDVADTCSKDVLSYKFQ